MKIKIGKKYILVNSKIYRDKDMETLSTLDSEDLNDGTTVRIEKEHIYCKNWYKPYGSRWYYNGIFLIPLSKLGEALYGR